MSRIKRYRLACKEGKKAAWMVRAKARRERPVNLNMVDVSRHEHKPLEWDLARGARSNEGVVAR